MQVFKIYDEKTRMYPSGKVATAEQVYADYPAMRVFPHIIGTDESDQIIFSINNLASMRSQYNIDPELSDEEAVTAIQEAVNNPPEPEPENPDEYVPTPEERQAIALEAIAAGRTSEQQMETDEAIAELTTMVAELQAAQA